MSSEPYSLVRMTLDERSTVYDTYLIPKRFAEGAAFLRVTALFVDARRVYDSASVQINLAQALSLEDADPKTVERVMRGTS